MVGELQPIGAHIYIHTHVLNLECCVEGSVDDPEP